MAKKKQIISEGNRKEIFYNLVNSLLSGGLVFFGGIVSGGFNVNVCLASAATAAIVALTKFKKYWDGEAGEYSSNLMNFI